MKAEKRRAGCRDQRDFRENYRVKLKLIRIFRNILIFRCKFNSTKLPIDFPPSTDPDKSDFPHRVDTNASK